MFINKIKRFEQGHSQNCAVCEKNRITLFKTVLFQNNRTKDKRANSDPPVVTDVASSVCLALFWWLTCRVGSWNHGRGLEYSHGNGQFWGDILGYTRYHRHHFICPIIQQYAHLRRYNFRRAGQQGPTRTLTAALKRVIKQLLGTYSITQVKYYKWDNYRNQSFQCCS